MLTKLIEALQTKKKNGFQILINKNVQETFDHLLVPQF